MNEPADDLRDINERWLTAREVAALTGWHWSTVYRKWDSGALPPRLAQRPAAGYALRCDKCGRATTHTVHDRGVEEIFTCSVCGREQVFQVR